MTENDRSAIRACAVREFVSRQSGAWSAADEKRLTEWLAADPAHRHAFDSVARLWTAAGELPFTARRRRAPRNQRLLSRPSVGQMAAAVAVAVLLILGGVRFSQWWFGISQSIATRIAEQKTLRLPDGSMITLDADSELMYQVGYGRRQATLMHGEALFSVIHEANRPFEVTAGAGHIVDRGTVFDVEARHDELRVSVLEGRVVLISASARAALAAGEGSGLDSEGHFTEVLKIDESVGEWREGRRVFRDMPLGRVLEYLERSQGVNFDLTTSSLAQLRVSGVFRMADLRAFLATLERSFPVRARWVSPDRIEIYSSS
ncbi:MAG TPA: FecR domain-containing protein [Nitrospiria bacterium]|nr:FecR domain-containing protein [Nitrospiria bacterium]